MSDFKEQIGTAGPCDISLIMWQCSGWGFCWRVVLSLSWVCRRLLIPLKRLCCQLSS